MTTFSCRVIEIKFNNSTRPENKTIRRSTHHSHFELVHYPSKKEKGVIIDPLNLFIEPLFNELGDVIKNKPRENHVLRPLSFYLRKNV